MLKFYLASWNFKDNYKLFESVSRTDRQTMENALQEGEIKEYVILSTCNRLEVYSTEDFTALDPFRTADIIRDADAVNHLFRVASGLESLSVGEQEILRQVKEAYEYSIKSGKSGKMLSIVFRKAISVGKKVRDETDISKGKVSLAAQATQIIESLPDKRTSRVMIVGTGKMASAIAKYIMKIPPSSLTICGRNEEHARQLSDSVGGSYLLLSDLPRGLRENNIIIAVTSSRNYLIGRNEMEDVNGDRLFIDLSNPRNVDPDIGGPGIRIIDLENIQPILEENMKAKKREVLMANRIVSQEMDNFSRKILEMETDDFISDIFLFSKLIEKESSDQLLHEVSKGVPLGTAVENMANSLVNKILAPHVLALKDLMREKGDGKMEETMRRFHSQLRSHYEDYLKKIEGRQAFQSQPDRTRLLNQKP
ncbi:MAG: glutamyl-tRNA reductase [Thermoplasmataceae archaeon]